MNKMRLPQVLLVPSCGVEPVDQLTPTDTLYRCKRGLELWHSGGYDYLLVTGGIFNPPDIQTAPAATLMSLWFLERGVPQDRILVESESLDTFENVAFGINVLQQAGCWPCRITVATQWQHCVRFLVTFLLAFGILIRPRFLQQPVSWRTWAWEWVYILYHCIDWRGTMGPARRNREARRQKNV